MIDLTDELYTVPEYEWRHVPIMVNHHKWWLRWYRLDEEGRFFFSFISPKKRCYAFFTERGRDGHGRVTDADVTLANGDTIASYWEVWGDKPDRLDAVIRLTPKHVLHRLSTLLDAIRTPIRTSSPSGQAAHLGKQASKDNI